jgi:tetratricopeptide (TPR) repeat protein
LIGRETNAYVLMLARRYQDSIATYREFTEEEPDFYKAYTSMGRTYSLMRQHDLAIEYLEKGRALGGDIPNIFGALGQTYAHAGDHVTARKLLSRLADMARTQYLSTTCFAVIHVGLGEKEEALDWLEEGCRRRDLTLAVLGIHPAYDDLHSEPRFQAILERVGLARRQ